MVIPLLVKVKVGRLLNNPRIQLILFKFDPNTIRLSTRLDQNLHLTHCYWVQHVRPCTEPTNTRRLYANAIIYNNKFTTTSTQRWKCCSIIFSSSHPHCIHSPVLDRKRYRSTDIMFMCQNVLREVSARQGTYVVVYCATVRFLEHERVLLTV